LGLIHRAEEYKFERNDGAKIGHTGFSRVEYLLQPPDGGVGRKMKPLDSKDGKKS